MIQVQQVPQDHLALQDMPQEAGRKGSPDPGVHQDHRDRQAHLELQGKMDCLEAKVKLVPQEQLGFQDSQDYRESLVLREKRAILVLGFQVLQALLDLQVNQGRRPCSWRGQDLKTLTVTQRLLGGLQGLLVPRDSQGPQELHLKTSFPDHLGSLEKMGGMERGVNLDCLELMEKMGIQDLLGRKETRENLV